MRPRVINEMLTILKAKHNSYKDFPITYLDTKSKYKFINLPLAGEDDLDETLMNVTDAMKTLVPPILEKLNLEILTETPQDANCFLSALLDQCR